MATFFVTLHLENKRTSIQSTLCVKYSTSQESASGKPYLVYLKPKSGCLSQNTSFLVNSSYSETKSLAELLTLFANVAYRQGYSNGQSSGLRDGITQGTIEGYTNEYLQCTAMPRPQDPTWFPIC